MADYEIVKLHKKGSDKAGEKKEKILLSAVGQLFQYSFSCFKINHKFSHIPRGNMHSFPKNKINLMLMQCFLTAMQNYAIIFNSLYHNIAFMSSKTRRFFMTFLHNFLAE